MDKIDVGLHDSTVGEFGRAVWALMGWHVD